MKQEGLLVHLDRTVRTLMHEDVIDVAKYYLGVKSSVGAGNFAIPRQVFCFVDYLGQIYKAPRPQKNHDCSYRAKCFIKDCFPEHYRDVASLLYDQWRHGTVHTLLPKVFKAGSETSKVHFGWLSSKDTSDTALESHMVPMHNEEDPDQLTIVVNIVKLAQDLESALNAFLDKLEASKELTKQCTERWMEIREPKIPPGDGADVILRFWKEPGGKLDKDGRQVLEIYGKKSEKE